MTRLAWLRGFRRVSCHEVAEVIQAFLDNEADERAARRVQRHLKDCRRCGMEAATYLEIKRSLRRRKPVPDPASIRRLRAFGEMLATGQIDADGAETGERA
ncbi:MAG: zf-HC2 domain-containing protein [Actinobacteria bacterium]|nr:zf-HC2 domain-containing protein [Actinomycetota bacterium]